MGFGSCYEHISICATPRDESIKNQLLQKAFVLIPYTFAAENMVLTGVESSYGVNNNSENVRYTLWGVDSTGTAQSLLDWDHVGGNKFAESLFNSVGSNDWDNKYLYVTGNLSSYDGSGFTVTVIFTNNNCLT